MNEMMQLLGWSDRTKFRKRFINPLIEKGILEMTIPDKPQSSNQRYVTTQIGRCHSSWVLTYKRRKSTTGF